MKSKLNYHFKALATLIVGFAMLIGAVFSIQQIVVLGVVPFWNWYYASLATFAPTCSSLYEQVQSTPCIDPFIAGVILFAIVASPFVLFALIHDLAKELEREDHLKRIEAEKVAAGLSEAKPKNKRMSPTESALRRS